jgi:hypothetical protein
LQREGHLLADLNTLRKRTNTWGQLMLSVLLLSWLSVSLQPCLMAMEHAPDMAMESGHSEHATHVEDATDLVSLDADCGHCPPVNCKSIDSGDVVISPECQPDSYFSLDSRRVKYNLKNAQFDLPASIAPPVTVPAISANKSMPSVVDLFSAVPGNRPPLNLLNCVYLI